MVLSLLSAGIGNTLANIGNVEANLFVFGIILIIIEMFAPGFGVAGGIGIAMLIVAIFMTANSLVEAMIFAFMLAGLIALMVFVTLRSAKKGVLAKKLILWSSSNKAGGYSSVEEPVELIGQKGVAVTLLRPSGTGEFDGKRLDVVSDSEYIEKDTPIVILRVEGRRIVVEAVE
jgi:membrane-bound ClpP family serine protease